MFEVNQNLEWVSHTSFDVLEKYPFHASVSYQAFDCLVDHWHEGNQMVLLEGQCTLLSCGKKMCELLPQIGLRKNSSGNFCRLGCHFVFWLRHQTGLFVGWLLLYDWDEFIFFFALTYDSLRIFSCTSFCCHLVLLIWLFESLVFVVFWKVIWEAIEAWRELDGLGVKRRFDFFEIVGEWVTVLNFEDASEC